MTVYGYSRVSTMRQADEGESLGAQERRLAGYAMIYGWEIGETFVESGVSGSTKFAERPAGARLVSILKPGDKIVCCKLDRCFRSALDALEQLGKFQAAGVELHLIDLGGNVCGNGIARLVFTILSAVAEAERDRIRERITDVKRDQKARGRYLGGKVPFGYRVDSEGMLYRDEADMKIVAAMHEMRGKGLSLRAIANTLTDNGYPISFRAVADVLGRDKAEVPQSCEPARSPEASVPA